jgi:hypothetical protein
MSEDPATITFDVKCNPNVTGTPTFILNDTFTCAVVVSFEHESGCPLADFGEYKSFLQDNPWFVAIIFILLGPILNFWGRKFIPWVIGIVTGLTAFTVLLIVFQFLGLLDWFDSSKTDTSGVAAFISIVVAIIIGFATGYFFKNKFLKIGFLILGGVAGFFLGGIVYTSFMVELNSLTYMWLTIIFFIIVGGCLAYYFE